MAMTASKLRANVYKVLDEVLETGAPVEVERKGKRLRIVPVEPRSKFDRLIRRPNFIKGDPQSIVHMNWSRYWRP